MISHATRRKILRTLHLILSIPVLGYIYGQPAEVQEYAAAVRFVFVPIIILSGFWMYAGILYAFIAVGVWLATYFLFGIGAALLTQMALLGAWQIVRLISTRRARETASPTGP